MQADHCKNIWLVLLFVMSLLRRNAQTHRAAPDAARGCRLRGRRNGRRERNR